MLPYQVVTVGIGQQRSRPRKSRPSGSITCRNLPPKRADPAPEATTVAIGIHPFVVGTPGSGRGPIKNMSPIVVLKNEAGYSIAVVSALRN
jgi:hypothetical protein